MFALILAGGKGERLRPLTNEIPKPMVPLCGRPILEHQIAWLREGGVTDVVFLAGYRWRAINDFFGDGRQFDIKTHYSIEDSPLGRGGALRKGFSLVTDADGPVVALNGDTITKENLSELLEKHEARSRVNASHLATLLVVPFVSPYGLVEFNDQSEVTGFRENAVLPYWVNAGIYVFDKKIASLLPEIGDHENLTFPKLAKRQQLLAVKSTKFWVGIDSFKQLREAEKSLQPQLGRNQG